MKIPLYVIEEILIRLQEFNPETGTLETCERLGSQMIVKTNKGMITVPLLLLNLQLNNPVTLREKDIELLASQFIKERGVERRPAID
ncbi:MAG: hypothetical protein V4456_02380 [Bacteroidota bacterium]